MAGQVCQKYGDFAMLHMRSAGLNLFLAASPRAVQAQALAMEKDMADSMEFHGSPSPEEIAYKLLYAVAWGENIDLDGWAKADRKWILDTYAECLLTVKDPVARMAARGPAKPNLSPGEPVG
jgi:hypothetical protein